MSASQPEFRPALPLTARTKTFIGAAFATAVGAGYVAFTKDWGAAMAGARNGLDAAQVYGEAVVSFGAMLGIPLYGMNVLSRSEPDADVANILFYALTAVGGVTGGLLAHDAQVDAAQQARLAKLPLLSEHTIIKAAPATARDEACKGIMVPKLASIVYEGKEFAVNCPVPAPAAE